MPLSLLFSLLALITITFSSCAKEATDPSQPTVGSDQSIPTIGQPTKMMTSTPVVIGSDLSTLGVTLEPTNEVSVATNEPTPTITSQISNTVPLTLSLQVIANVSLQAFTQSTMEQSIVSIDYEEGDGQLTSGQIVITNPERTQITVLSGYLISQGLYIRWSPTGNYLAFTAKQEYQELFVVDMHSGDIIQITSGEGIEMTPSWSPDETKLAFATFVSGSGQIHVFDFVTKKLSQLTDEGSNSSPDWSPDGERILYSHTPKGINHTADIYVMNADGTEKKVLLSDGAFNDEARWSPDGKYIAYSQQWLGAGFRSHVYIMQSSGANSRALVTVSSPLVNQWQPIWMEDSRTLLFEAKDLDSGVCQFVVGNVSSDKGVLVSEGECVRFFDLHIWHLP